MSPCSAWQAELGRALAAAIAAALGETERQPIEQIARARSWTLCLYALVLCALTGPLAALLTPLAHDPSSILHVVAAVLAAALVGAYVALAVLLIAAVLRVVRPRPDGRP